jgi:hypothetical protein
VSRSESEFVADCATLGELLSGPAREQILDAVSGARTFERALLWLRDGVRAHRFQTAAGDFSLAPLVKRWENRGRQAGFHLLHDWDGKVDRFREDTIPVEVANLARSLPIPETPGAQRNALAILLDYDLLYVLILLALAALDQRDSDAALGEVSRLLASLQSPRGSGHRFVGDPLTLILIGTAHFEPDITAYDRLRLKIAKLAAAHRVEMALAHAPILGCHLGFGLEVTCAGDLKALREDNVPDYPWLAMAIATLLEELTPPTPTTPSSTSSPTTTMLLDALASALSADPHAFTTAETPDSLSSMARERDIIRIALDAHRDVLLAEFAKRAPSEDAYSPLSFSFNFPHNLVKGLVVDALLRGSPGGVTLNDLLARTTDSAESEHRRAAARTLMGFALASPDNIRGRPHPAIVYDASVGKRAFDRLLGGVSASRSN